MKKTLSPLVLYIAGPAVVLVFLAVASLVALIASPVFATHAGIPVTGAGVNAASLAGLLVSLSGAAVLGASLWWLGKKGK